MTISATAAGRVSARVNSVARLTASRPPESSPALQPARQVGQQHDADRDADDAERQLVEPVGVGEPGDGAVEERADLAADEQVDLHHAAGEHRRRHDHARAGAAPGVSRGQRGSDRHARPRRAAPPDQRQLRDAGDRHRPDLPEADVAAASSQPISRKAIITTFIRIGAAAASAKRPSAFSTPESSAVSEMKRM